ncbi:hypothetical protein PFICI_09292 [Pestalotiopsis fici W106-1]|uniref:Indole-diterpene biosynthesis protein PaxU n=1 Tax=Pestalotiopsis fici (strain W106-1 / CGMCC3.15140) TaxID=1229662 RepID=W3X087_PESFW|nr:uncharacterized protein PFICI_09292 [Pestalotiopsis fici W106-1]ETS79439.1 hypothetical protein PFICI_09292 [Pestalotiopsis fici W106-1]
MAEQRQPLKTMTKASPFVYFYEPSSSSSAVTDTENGSPAAAATANAIIGDGTTTAAPKLILVASWMDARDLHIAKYITRYQTLYPTSRILLVKFVFRHIVWRSECIAAVRPALSYIRSLMSSGVLSSESEDNDSSSTTLKEQQQSPPEILLHVFSNGGVASSKELFEAYEAETGGRPFPRHTAVYDSCPGLYSYWSAYNASIAGFPRGSLLRWLMAPLIHLLDMYLWVVAVALRRPYNLIINADRHNDAARTRQACRAYIYGRGDDMVDWRHVEKHARQAEARGYDVRAEVFEEGTHVAHVRVDEARYWRIVAETWDKSQSTVS